MLICFFVFVNIYSKQWLNNIIIKKVKKIIGSLYLFTKFLSKSCYYFFRKNSKYRSYLLFIKITNNNIYLHAAYFSPSFFNLFYFAVSYSLIIVFSTNYSMLMQFEILSLHMERLLNSNNDYIYFILQYHCYDVPIVAYLLM